MSVRMKVPWDDGTVRLAQGEEYSEFSQGMERRLIRSGLAEDITGTDALNRARSVAGMVPLKDEMKGLRHEYRRALGKNPSSRWGAAELRRRIAEAG